MIYRIWIWLYRLLEAGGFFGKYTLHSLNTDTVYIHEGTMVKGLFTLHCELDWMRRSNLCDINKLYDFVTSWLYF